MLSLYYNPAPNHFTPFLHNKHGLVTLYNTFMITLGYPCNILCAHGLLCVVKMCWFFIDVSSEKDENAFFSVHCFVSEALSCPFIMLPLEHSHLYLIFKFNQIFVSA